MLQNITIWILLIGKIIWEYDKFFSNPQFEKNLSVGYHFIIFSLILTIILFFLNNYFFPKNKADFIQSMYWIGLITMLSASGENKIGKDLNYIHFIFCSISIYYCMYTHKQFYPKEETFIIPKILIIFGIVLKILWPPLFHVWPYWPRKERPYREDLFDDWFDTYL